MAIEASVGKGGKNFLRDVQIVQGLLLQNTQFLIPLRVPAPKGFCDGKTVLLIQEFQRRALRMSAPTGLVEPDSPTWFALNAQSGASPSSSTEDDRLLGQALDLFDSEAISFAMRFIQDRGVRETYLLKAQEVSRSIQEEVAAGVSTAKEGALKAQTMRNALLEAGRLNNSDVGRAVSEAEKQSGLTIEELLAKYAKKLFGKDFEALTTAEQDKVFMEVIRAAGRPNERYTRLARNMGRVGKGLFILSLALAVYQVASSDRPGREAAKQGALFGSGFLGSLAGGAAAGLACGPGAPICVGVGAFAGGLVFVLGADFAFDQIWH